MTTDTFGKLLPELGDDVSEAVDPLDAPHDDDPITDNGGAMTLDGLRLFFIARDDDRDARDAKRSQEDRLWKENHEREAREQRKAFFDELNMHSKRLDVVERGLKFGAHGPLWAIAFLIGLIIFVELYRIDHPSVRYVLATPEMIDVLRKVSR